MIVHPPEVHRRDGEVIFSSRIETDRELFLSSETIWYALPEKYEPLISQTPEPFATALLPLAMALGEPMSVRGPLSSQLLYGMYEYQKVFAIWWPGEQTRVDIMSDEIISRRGDATLGKVASTFSGGLDSGYTVWRHLPRNQPDPNYHLNYAILIQGFDLSIDDEIGFKQCVEMYSTLIRSEGVELIPVRTNLRQVIKPIIRWDISQGAALNSIGLLFSPLLTKYLIPASDNYFTSVRWGTHPLVDHLLSSETLEVIHHGAALTRFDKFQAVADWDEFLAIIRVCFHDPKGPLNCGHCLKCNRAMAALELMGKLDNWKTMPGPKGRQQIRMARAHFPAQYLDIRKMVAYADKIGRKDVAFDLRYALFRTRAESALHRLLGDKLFEWAKTAKNLLRH